MNAPELMPASTRRPVSHASRMSFAVLVAGIFLNRDACICGGPPRPVPVPEASAAPSATPPAPSAAGSAAP